MKFVVFFIFIVTLINTWCVSKLFKDVQLVAEDVQVVFYGELQEWNCKPTEIQEAT